MLQLMRLKYFHTGTRLHFAFSQIARSIQPSLLSTIIINNARWLDTVHCWIAYFVAFNRFYTLISSFRPRYTVLHRPISSDVSSIFRAQFQYFFLDINSTHIQGYKRSMLNWTFQWGIARLAIRFQPRCFVSSFFFCFFFTAKRPMCSLWHARSIYIVYS